MDIPNDSLDALVTSRMNRRSLIKRAGLMGLTLPTAGALLNACGGSSANKPASTTTGAQTTNAAPQGMTEVTVTAMDLKFEPSEVSVPAGQPVRFTFINKGAIEHDWDIVGGIEVSDLKVVSKPQGFSARMEDLLKQTSAQNVPYAGAGPNQHMVIEFTPIKAGTFDMGCMVPGHEAAGMLGQFIVTGTSAAAATAANTTEADSHMMPATTPASGTPYAADRLQNPIVAPAIGQRAAQVVPVEVEIKEVIGYLDDGVAYQFWTFGGSVPGPMLRVRVGDTIELTLKNPADSTMPHNIDLHAVTGPGGGGKVTTVAPGQSATFRFKALNPGVYVYHCATPPIPHHIMSGMYGLIVVEPAGGLPKVDREFYVMQGDFYLEGERGAKGLRGVSMDKLLDERPDYVVFNGAVGSVSAARGFMAKVGETVRIFFGVGGPNITSSFHVIGEIFDRVYPEGASEPMSNVQTTLVPAGGATMVEFTCQVPGTYLLVDHSLGRLGKGAVGMLEVEGEANAEVFEVVRAAS